MLLLNLFVGTALMRGDDDARLAKATGAIKLQLASMDRFAKDAKAEIGGSRGNRLLLSKLPVRAGAKAPLDVEVKSFTPIDGKAAFGASAAKALVAQLEKDGSVASVSVKTLNPKGSGTEAPGRFLVKIRHKNQPTGAEYVDTWQNSDGACWVVERKIAMGP